MKIKDLKEFIKNIPDESDIDIYDLRSYTHPNFTIRKDSPYFDYDRGLPIFTIEINTD